MLLFSSQPKYFFLQSSPMQKNDYQQQAAKYIWWLILAIFPTVWESNSICTRFTGGWFPPPRSYFKSSASPGLSISYFCCLSRELLIPRSDTVQLHHLAPQLVIVLWLLKSWTCSQWRAVCTKLTEVSERSRDFLGQLQPKVMASLCRMRQTVPYAVSLFIYKLSNSTLDILFWLL